MVNICALERISRYIESDRLIKPMKKWSNRFLRSNNDEFDNRSWYVKRLINQIRDLLVLVSGDDVVQMLKGVKLILLCLFLKNLYMT